MHVMLEDDISEITDGSETPILVITMPTPFHSGFEELEKTIRTSNRTKTSTKKADKSPKKPRRHPSVKNLTQPTTHQL